MEAACQDCIDLYECPHAYEEMGIIFCDKDPTQYCPLEHIAEDMAIDAAIDDAIQRGASW